MFLPVTVRVCGRLLTGNEGGFPRLGPPPDWKFQAALKNHVVAEGRRHFDVGPCDAKECGKEEAGKEGAVGGTTSSAPNSKKGPASIRRKSAGGGTRTRTLVSQKRILSPLRLPFRHAGNN